MSSVLYLRDRETNEWIPITSIKGKNGVGIQKTEINTNGELEITYTDNTSVNIGKIVGDTGTNGKTAFEYAVEGGYNDTEEQFSVDLCEAVSIGKDLNTILATLSNGGVQ
jgi:hypothetical protein